MTPRETLAAGIERLPERDRAFARDLLSKPSTPGREKWIGILAERLAMGSDSAGMDSRGADFLPVFNFLHAARQGLKAPKLRVDCGGFGVLLTIAGERSQRPGSIDIRSGETTGISPATGFPSRDWYGRITADGALYLSARCVGIADRRVALEAALRALAADPIGHAKLYGKLTERCCFCGQELTDGASIAAGYGPICAGHWGLPWGDDHGVKGGWREQDAAGFDFSAGTGRAGR